MGMAQAERGAAATDTVSRMPRRAVRALLVALALLVAAALVLSTCPPPAAGQQGTDWRDEALYLVMADRFANGDPGNDGDAAPGQLDWWQGGDLKGVIEKLDYIKGLGMTAIWLTPVSAQTRGGYHGYWTLDFDRVDPHLGDLATLKELVGAAHSRGLKVVLDVVLNHVGYDHPWLRDPARAGWFHDECAIQFTDPPSVERCWLAGLPDLDTESRAVRAFLTDWSLRLIRETGVDGFGVDAARHLPKDFLREWSAAIKREFPRFWLLGEVFVPSYLVQAPYLDAGLDAITDFFTYDVVRQALAPQGDLSLLPLPPAEAATRFGERAFARATFIDNHDVPRFVGASPADAEAKARLKQALAYLFTAPGTPVLLYGTEVALHGGRDPDNRRMMPWGDDANAGVRTFVRTVATLRQQSPALRRGEFVALASDARSLVYARRLGGELLLVALAEGGTERVAIEAALEAFRLQEGSWLQPQLEPALGAGALRAATLHATLPPRGVQVWRVMPPRSVAPTPFLAAVSVAIGLALVALALALARRRRPGTGS